MSKDLTNSEIDRKNILNNRYAIEAVYERIGWKGIEFEKRVRFTRAQVARLFEVDIRTVNRLLENHQKELEESGYELFTGNRLTAFKEVLKTHFDGRDAQDIDVLSIGAWKQELNPETCRVIFRDNGFTDVEKTNAVQTLKRYGVEEVRSV